jgi:hypothetical protein
MAEGFATVSGLVTHPPGEGDCMEIKPSITLGSVIAFLAPGFVALAAAAFRVPVAKSWIDASAAGNQDVGVFLFVLLASLALGVFVSGLRSILLDRLYYKRILWLKPIPRQPIRFSELKDRHVWFEGIVENYYRYYQFYGNSLIALLIYSVVHETSVSVRSPAATYVTVGVVILVLFFSARASLSDYSAAIARLLSDKEAV